MNRPVNSVSLHPGLKKTIKLFVPPVLILAAKRLLAVVSRRKPAWEYVPEGWQAAQRDPAIKGWNVQSVLHCNIKEFGTRKRSIDVEESLSFRVFIEESQG